MSAINKKPEIVIFAGPNGSGKSTFTELLKPHGNGFTVLIEGHRDEHIYYFTLLNERK